MQTEKILTEVSPQKDDVLAALKSVIDPEIGINIVDLGLIYDVQVIDGMVGVKMTLTTPGCPLHSYMTEGVRAAVSRVGGVTQCAVMLVWDPPWNPSMMQRPL